MSSLLTDSSHTFTFILECITASDCPNGGQDYQCITNVCYCPYGFVLNGKTCEPQGMYYLFQRYHLFNKAKGLALFYEQLWF